MKAEEHRQSMKQHHADRFSRMSRGERSAGGESRREARKRRTGVMIAEHEDAERSRSTSFSSRYSIPNEAAPYLEHLHDSTKKVGKIK